MQIKAKTNGEGEPEILVEGATIDLGNLKREDGFLTQQNSQTQSLLHRILTPPASNKDYRQELKMALFQSTDEADLAVSALDECFTLGMDPTPIIDQIIARSAGVNRDLAMSIMNTLTHTTFTTNYKGKDNDKSRNHSPIN